MLKLFQFLYLQVTVVICYLRDLSFNNDHVLSKEFCEITNFAEFFFFFFFWNIKLAYSATKNEAWVMCCSKFTSNKIIRVSMVTLPRESNGNIDSFMSKAVSSVKLHGNFLKQIKYCQLISGLYVIILERLEVIKYQWAYQLKMT